MNFILITKTLLGDKTLSPSLKLFYGWLMSWPDGICAASEESIAEKFNVSVSSVNQWIKILKERDLIQQSEEDHDYGTIYVNRNECLFSCNRITKYGLSPEDWCKLNEMEEIKENDRT